MVLLINYRIQQYLPYQTTPGTVKCEFIFKQLLFLFSLANNIILDAYQTSTDLYSGTSSILASPSSTGDNSNVTDTLTQTILNGNSSVTPQKRHLEHNDSPVSQNESTLHESFEPSSSHANSRVVKHPASISQPSSHVHGSDVQESITLSIPSHINSVEFAIPNSRPEHTNNSNILVDTSNNSSYHTFLQRDLADESNLTPESLTRRRYQLRERTAAQIAPYRHERQAIRQAFGEEAYRKLLAMRKPMLKQSSRYTQETS